MKIEDYSFGRIVVDGKEILSDVIIYPDRVEAHWWRKEGHRLLPEDLGDILLDPPEILVIGTGHEGGMVVSLEAFALLRERGMQVIVEPTVDAVQDYNRLAKKQRRVIAALHLTC